MKTVSTFLKILIVVGILVTASVFVVVNYSWVFAKNVVGKVVDVERVTDPSAVFGSRATEAQMYSYSVLIQGDDGQLYTASSEDRQWQVVKKGYCVEALLYRNPPWHLQNAGTFFNARLKNVRVCPGEAALPQGTPGAAQPQGAPPVTTTPPAPPETH